MKNVVYDFIITEAIETASPMQKDQWHQNVVTSDAVLVTSFV